MSSLSQKMQRQQFYPGILGMFINPFYHMRRELLRNISSLAPEISGKTLDIGCGSKPYEKLFSKSTKYVGMDYDSPEKHIRTKADVFYDGSHFPFPDGAFDSAIATEVLEHIFNPDQFLSETARVLKSGATLLLTCPFVWDEHEQPYDYARYSSFGVAHLLTSHGFKITTQKKSAADIRALCQLTNCYIHKAIPFKNYKVRLCFYIIFTAPVTIAGLIFWRILPKNKDLYLSNIIVAKKI